MIRERLTKTNKNVKHFDVWLKNFIGAAWLQECKGSDFSLAVGADLLLGAPGAHAVEVEEVLAAQSDARLRLLELVSADCAPR